MRFGVLAAVALGLVSTAVHAGTNARPVPVSCWAWNGDKSVAGRPPFDDLGYTPSQAARAAQDIDAHFIQDGVVVAMEGDHLGWGAPTITQTSLFADAFCAIYPSAKDVTALVVRAAEDVARRRLATGR